MNTTNRVYILWIMKNTVFWTWCTIKKYVKLVVNQKNCGGGFAFSVQDMTSVPVNITNDKEL